MLGLEFDQWLDAIQLVALIAGGSWALFIYRLTRRGQVKVGIAATSKVAHSLVPGKAVLLLRLVITNTSDVLWRYESAVVTLFDARKLAENGDLRLAPFAQADPFLPVYGVETEDPEAIAEGKPFSFFEGQQITLEPSEQLVSELAFPVDEDKVGLMAVKVWVRGQQRNRAKEPYEWGSFMYVDRSGSGGDSVQFATQ